MTLASLTPNVVVIHVDALEAALANLNLTGITAAQLLDAVKKEEKSLEAPNYLDVLNSPPQDQPGSTPPYQSTFTMKPITGTDDADKARRLKLRDLARKDFPHGKMPDLPGGAATETCLHGLRDPVTPDSPIDIIEEVL